MSVVSNYPDLRMRTKVVLKHACWWKVWLVLGHLKEQSVRGRQGIWLHHWADVIANSKEGEVWVIE